MKKLLSLLFLCLFVSACGNDSTKETFHEYAKTYYTNHMSMTNAENVSITKNMLIAASDEDGYDMSKLSNCTNSSTVTLKIENKKIIEITDNLDCK